MHGGGGGGGLNSWPWAFPERSLGGWRYISYFGDLDLLKLLLQAARMGVNFVYKGRYIV